MSTEVYGVAFQSPLVLWPLIPPRRYYPILLVNESTSQIKEDVKLQMTEQDTRKKTAVVLAGSITILQNFLKLFPKMECKIFLFDFPSFLVPFFHPSLRWLDCDHQAGGAWQVAKIKPEDLVGLLDDLKPVSKSGREFLLSVKRYQAKDRIGEIEAFVQNVPKHYKELLSLNDNEQKSPLKVAKDARKTREGLKSLLHTSLELVHKRDTRKELVLLVLNYAAEQIGKRDFLSKLALLTSDEFLKKEFLAIRKWIDAKSGAILRDALHDYSVNHERRSWETVLSTYKKVVEEDLAMLVTFCKETALQASEDRIAPYRNLASDKSPPKRPNHPELPVLGKSFNF